MAHSRSIAVLSLVSAVVPVLVACGSDPPPAPQTAPTSTATVPPAPSASASASASVSASASASAGTPSADGVDADAMGLGDIGTLGSGGKASTKPPRLGHGTTTTSGSGKLPVEVIDRIVRQQYGRFRLCYEKGLQSDPTLTGKVTVKFVIDASGNVSSVTDGGSDLKDSTTTGCVLRGLKNASFPAPTGGTVTVSYPLTFTPPAP